MSAASPAPRAPRLLTAVALGALVASALVGGNAFDSRHRLFGLRPSGAVASSRTIFHGLGPAAPGQVTTSRSQPWWQDMALLEGAAGTRTAALSISSEALQWRVQWSCAGEGRLQMRATSSRRPLIDAVCPTSGVSSATSTGAIKAKVRADGPWTMQFAQQVDVPLDEPRSPAMGDTGATVTARGEFAGVDQAGAGSIDVYRLVDGTFALRLESFFVTPNSDLEIRLSPLASIRSTEEFTAAPSVRIAPLDITAGSLNVVVPAAVSPGDFASVVIWCERLHSAYAVAPLRSP